MAYPDAPAIGYSYTGFQEGQGSNVFPGVQLDGDLANVKTSVTGVVDFLKVAHAEDGNLKTGSVARKHLAADILLGLPEPRPWETNHPYAVNDTATFSNGLYIAEAAHTSGVFATDQASGYWTLLMLFTVSSTPSDGSVTTAKVVDRSVTRPKIGLLAVGSAELDAVVDPAHLVPGYGLVEVGIEADFAGIRAPAKWLLEAGQAVPRTTYALLLAVLTETATGDTTLNSPVLANVSKDLTGLGLEGAKIEGAGLPAGVTVISTTSTSVTLSANVVTASAAGVALRIFPYGNGDASTTFNVPDRRGQVTAGRDNMLGTAAGRLTAGAGIVDGRRLSAFGGEERHTLTQTEMPVHGHNFTGNALGNHSHTFSDATPVSNGTSVGASAGAISGWNVSQVADTTDAASAGTPSGSISLSGADGPHNNVQPTGIANKIIFAGV